MRKESAMNLAALLKCKFLSQNHVDTDKDNRALRGAVYASFQDLYLEQQTHQKLKKEDALLSAIKLAPSLTLWLMKSFDQEAIKEYDHQCRNGKVSFAKMFDNELRARNLVDKRGDPISCEDMIKLLPTNTETLLNTVTISYNGLDVSVREFLEISRYEHYPWI